MTAPAKPNDVSNIKRILQLQLLIILLFTTLSYVVGSKQHAQAFLLGSVIAWIGHYLFAIISFKVTGARVSKQIVSNMFRGHMLKWIITIILFAIVFKLALITRPDILILGFIFSQVLNMLFAFVKR